MRCAARRGAEYCIIAPYPRCKVAGVLMRGWMWGALVERRGSSSELGNPGIEDDVAGPSGH